jgi:hypothetical protein
MGNLKFTYGIPVTSRVSAYARVGVGIGGEKSVFKSNLINSTEKNDLFGFHGGLGFPIQLGESHSYFTPRIFYDHLKTKYDDGDQVESGIRVGFGMESYLGCSDYMCDCKHGFSLSKNMYNQGHHFIGFSSMGGLDFGSSKLSLNSNNNNIKADHSRQMINLDYNYFILDYLALGAGIGLGRQRDEPKNSNYTYTLTTWNVMPVITGHIPVTNGWNNFFVQAQGDFGGQKFVTDDAGNKTTQKSKLSGFGFGLGYNDHFSKGLSITPIIQYKIENDKDEDTNVKTKSKGIVFEIGVRSFF